MNTNLMNIFIKNIKECKVIKNNYDMVFDIYDTLTGLHTLGYKELDYTELTKELINSLDISSNELIESITKEELWWIDDYRMNTVEILAGSIIIYYTKDRFDIPISYTAHISNEFLSVQLLLYKAKEHKEFRPIVDYVTEKIIECSTEYSEGEKNTLRNISKNIYY